MRPPAPTKVDGGDWADSSPLNGPRHVTLVMTHLYRCSVVSVCLVVPNVTLFVTDRVDAKWVFALFEDVKRGMRAELASAMLEAVGFWNCVSLLSRERHGYQ